MLCPAIIWLLPFLLQRSPFYLIARLAFSALCHQQPDRSFVVNGMLMMVCARCAAIYTGLPIGVFFCAPVFKWVRKLQPSKLQSERIPISPGGVAVFISALPAAFELAAEKLGFPTGNLSRFFATFPFGTALGLIAGHFLRTTSLETERTIVMTGALRQLKQGSVT